MGVDNSRVIKMDNMPARLRKGKNKVPKNCTIYGDVLEVEYEGHVLNLSKTQFGEPPRQDSVHYFI